MGTIRGYLVRIKGDGAGRLVTVPFSRIEGVWTQNITETLRLKAGSTAPYITYVTPPTYNLYHFLVVIGY